MLGRGSSQLQKWQLQVGLNHCSQNGKNYKGTRTVFRTIICGTVLALIHDKPQLGQNPKGPFRYMAFTWALTGLPHLYVGTIQSKPESWNVTILQPQSPKKKENHHRSFQAHIPTFWNLLKWHLDALQPSV